MGLYDDWFSSNDESAALDQQTDIPEEYPVIPAIPNSPDDGLEYNTIPDDTYVQPALVDSNDPNNNVMPGAQAAASSAGSLNPANKNPTTWSFFSEAFKNFSPSVSTDGQIDTKSGSDAHRLTSSPLGNVGAQNNPPPVNEAISIVNRGLESVTSSMDQYAAWNGMLGSVQPVKRTVVVTPKVKQSNNNMMIYAGVAVAALFGFMLLARG